MDDGFEVDFILLEDAMSGETEICIAFASSSSCSSCSIALDRAEADEDEDGRDLSESLSFWALFLLDKEEEISLFSFCLSASEWGEGIDLAAPLNPAPDGAAEPEAEIDPIPI